MAQADYNIVNKPGAGYRAEANAIFLAIVTNNSGPDEPEDTWPFMTWADETAGKMKLRNGANDGWITLCDLAAGMTLADVVGLADALAGKLGVDETAASARYA